MKDGPRAELAVALLLLAAAGCAVAFVVVYGVSGDTQLLGLSLGLALGLVAAALIVLAHRVLPTEELEDDYPEDSEEAAEDVDEIVRDGAGAITRKRLLVGAGGAAGCALGVAAVAPAVSLGPLFDTSGLKDSPWKRGVLLVDEQNAPVKAEDIEEGPFYTAFPQGAEKDSIAAPVVLVRLPIADLDLPASRRRWAPQGILAYSKTCTHAGCAISLYRSPLYEPTSRRPALVCPCHYSTFDPARGAEVVFGPAGRPLPQLPLVIDPGGLLRAGGEYSDRPGPSWSGVRT